MIKERQRNQTSLQSIFPTFQPFQLQGILTALEGNIHKNVNWQDVTYKTI